MSVEAAAAFIQRIDGDQALAAELAGLKDDPDAVRARAHAEGFDFEPAEARQAILKQYPGALTADQLDQIAAGGDWGPITILPWEDPRRPIGIAPLNENTLTAIAGTI
jgi:predicted ribosomally synthesized peptide with nif11-like leader